MYSIDLVLKNVPLPISVQRQEKEEAEALYREIKAAIEYPSNKVLELTCQREEERKVAVISEQIVAVTISKKTGSAAGGRPPGFFAMMGAES